ncbi:xanthine dehydrogenase [Folsomia candida]|uniref:xanthine dehydrogenase n=1 Tax=Folsomia candida TaxID=158441 RepID=UPI000B90A1FE|nr:xanthine dehydrogenase [Folsomia candida]
MGKGSGSNASTISFTINGKEYHVDANTSNVNSETMLVDFIRDHASLKGTKVMCREGGCGACVVTVRTKDAAIGADVTKGINSCMTPVYSCQGWDISTVEDLGNKDVGYDVIQNRLVNFHGTQCGYCTPGMIMSMNSLRESKKDGLVTVKEVEDNFDGNICRCTGYRPILDAFKSLAVDALEDLKRKCDDIEDCASCPCPMRQGQGRKCDKAKPKENSTIVLANGSVWTTAVDLKVVFQAIKQSNSDGKRMRFVAGNTSTGVYKHEGPYSSYIEINGIPELKQKKVDSCEVLLGGGVTLTAAIAFFADVAKTKAGFEYVAQISKHMERIANVPVRNNATIAGNLMIKHAHHDFPSDVFVLLETAGAKLTIASSDCTIGMKLVTMMDFLKTDMNGKLILSVHFPKRSTDYHFRSFKITRRFQNAHAYVNAGFLLKVVDGKIAEQPRICYGGINPQFVHATATEEFLAKNPDIGNDQVLQNAFQILDKEIKPDFHPPEAIPEYRKFLTQSLLYKTILGILPGKASQHIKSGGPDIPRSISKGTQVFESDKSDSRLYKAMPKYEGAWQASGEAEYTTDIPKRPDELFGVFILSTIGSGTLKSIDATEALAMPGVVQLITAKDIKGKNNFMEFFFFPTAAPQPVFVNVGDKVSYHGQSIGLLLAENRQIAVEASRKVKVAYEGVTKPIVDIMDAIKNVEAAGLLPKHFIGTFTSEGDPSVSVNHTISGDMKIGSQYHYFMETLNCLCIPREDGIDMHIPTQWMDHTQNNLALVLGIPCSSINIQVKRIGGGFGGKITQPAHIAAAAAVAATTVRQPVRIVLDIETNMKMLGRRLPFYMKYEVGFNDVGKIGNLKTEIFCDAGFTPNEADSIIAAMHMQNVYKALGWEVKPGFVTTNTATNTSVRAPGSVKGVALIENIMEHIAFYLKKESLLVRQVNFIEKGDPFLPTFFGGGNFEEENQIPRLVEEMKKSGDYENRKKFVETFNKENRWKKRGLSLIPVKFHVGYEFGCNFPAMIAIYHFDGTVSCTHGGVEMGQGLQTKVLQTIAQSFQIPMDKIKLKPTNNFVGANAFSSGGSIASEVCCFAALRACETIKERLKPILEKLENPTWEQLIAAAHQAKIDLTASYTPGPKDDLKEYEVWALALAEVEIDVLTGEYKVARTDLIEDCGKSLSPGVDLGQIEGGYIFGQGMWTTERIVHCKETGELLTNRTWEYKPPETKDIPEDFRVSLLKDAPNPHGILRSKATGEPILCATVAVYFALRNAITAARADKGNTEWFKLDSPITPEDVYQHCLTTSTDFKF